jgi:predicted transcriptional regulator
MQPIDYRNNTWFDIQAKLEGSRARIYNALMIHGPCTTRELASRIGMDILTVRPRVTELCQLVLAQCTDEEGREGNYLGIPIHIAKMEFERRKEARARCYQPELNLK